VVSAVNKAERDGAIVLRVFEAEGAAAQTPVEFLGRKHAGISVDGEVEPPVAVHSGLPNMVSLVVLRQEFHGSLFWTARCGATSSGVSCPSDFGGLLVARAPQGSQHLINGFKRAVDATFSDVFQRLGNRAVHDCLGGESDFAPLRFGFQHIAHLDADPATHDQRLT